MPLTLEYTDKYSLWNDLVRGSTDRLFVPSNERHRLGEVVTLKTHVDGVSLPVVAQATVLAMRQTSRRFRAGVYVHIPDRELTKFRRFLELQPKRGMFDRHRQARRLHREFTVRFSEPEDDGKYVTRNISETGMFVTCPDGIAGGQQVRLYIMLDDAPVPLDAEVVWASKEQGVAGLRIAEISERAAKALHDAIEGQLKLDKDEGGPQPILVADDDPDILSFISTALQRSGHEVYKSGHGDETLELIRQLQPALIVMDILMPGTDGAEICKVMRSDAELVDIQVIFVSALPEAKLHVVADEAGANDYLPKPLRLDALMEMVSYYLERA